MGESLIQPTLVGPQIAPMVCATFLDRNVPVPGKGTGLVRPSGRTGTGSSDPGESCIHVSCRIPDPDLVRSKDRRPYRVRSGPYS